MNEEAWVGCIDPTPMLEFMQGKSSDRKMRLFGVACCRRVWHLFTNEQCRETVELGERLADGLVANEERRAAALFGQTQGWYGWFAAGMVLGKPAIESVGLGSDHAARMVATANTSQPQIVGNNRRNPRYEPEFYQHMERERFAQTALLHDIFGNPFRPITFAPESRTDTAIAIASQMYESRDFSAMPILADALQDAGCDNPDVLNHCRQGGPHVRGCWVVDLVLGKE